MKIGRNVAWNVAEVLASSAGLFVLYWIVVRELGLESLGVWSLVLATTSLARVADVGATAGLGRFVAMAKMDAELGKTPRTEPIAYVETTLVINGVLFLCIALVAYWPADRALLVALGANAAEARQLLPFAILSFVLASLGSVMSVSLLGLDRSDVKSAIMIAAICVQLAISATLIHFWGLRSVAIGQVAQSVFLIIVGWFAVVWILEGRPRFRLPRGPRLNLLRPLFSFGVRMQAVSVASLLYEPAVKFAFATTGGLAALGVFEMAFRLVTQTRQILVAPSQNLLPLYVAARYDPNRLGQIYRIACIVMWPAGVVGFASLTIATPVISILWIGHLEWTLVGYVGLLCVGWFMNLACVPAFLLATATGRLRWNILGSGLASALALGLGWSLGEAFGPIGTVLAASVAIGTGGFVMLIMNAKFSGLETWPSREDIQLLAIHARLLLQKS